MDNLYCRYFDQQFEMIQILKPAVVGHFDLIRIFDDDYASRMTKPAIMEKIRRNLTLIKDLDLIMDYNFRSLLKGANEPYISRPILKIARDMGIAVVPGDDSHSLQSIGINMEIGIARLQKMGFDTNWRQPKVYVY